jgi:hypothetical protein
MYQTPPVNSNLSNGIAAKTSNHLPTPRSSDWEPLYQSIPFTFDGSQSSFQLNYEQYCNDTSISSDQQTSTSTIINKASPVIADSFIKCMALPGLQYRTMTVGADILIAAKFNSDGPQTEARITTVDPSPNLKCDSTALTRAPIRGGEVPMTCRRTDLKVSLRSSGSGLIG